MEEKQQLSKKVADPEGSLTRREKRALAREQKRKERTKEEFKSKSKKFLISILVVGILGGGGYYWWTNQEILPPTDFSGHIEQSPPSHILDEPIPILIQKHMLEHADGGGPPGVVINYNCEGFDCEPGMIEQLAEIASQYPEFVYVAPYPEMTKKLAITRYQRIQTFDNLDREVLVKFIENK